MRMVREVAYLPPITFASPLNTFERLLTTMSAYGRTSTLQKFPSVSSTTSRKSYLSASARSRGRSGARSSGFDGNSVNSASAGGAADGDVEAAASSPRSESRASMSVSRPWPKK